MKNLKSLFVALALISLTAGQANTNVPNNVQNTAVSQQLLRITCEQVSIYLQNNGHVVITTPYSSDGGYTWFCVTTVHGVYYNSTVFTDGTNITGFADVIIN